MKEDLKEFLIKEVEEITITRKNLKGSDLTSYFSGQLLSSANRFLKNPRKFVFPHKNRDGVLGKIFISLCQRHEKGLDGYFSDPVCLALFKELIFRMRMIDRKRRKKEGS